MRSETVSRVFIVRLLLFVGTVASLGFVPWPIVRGWLRPLPDSIQAQVDEALDLGFTGALVCVDVAGQAPRSFASGWHDPAARIPARPDALFKVASIEKLYRAVAVSKLVARGKLGLDSPLSALLPELADRIEGADRITLRMLVQHRSGIPNYTDTEGYWLAPPGTDAGNLALVLDRPADFEPGARFAYCNTNYLLLGWIMDRALGQPHWAFIEEAILDRLGLERTFASESAVDPSEIMSGFHVGYPHDLKGAPVGMVVSAADVARFVRALNDGSVFDAGERELYGSLYALEHTGLVPGYQSIARYFPETDAVVVQCTTPTNFEGYEWNLGTVLFNRVASLVEAGAP